MGINSRKLNYVGTVAILVSGMIGSAIFSLSGLTIYYAGPASIISWILAAVIQLCYGLSMAELATTYKKNGGVFVFPEQTFKKNGEMIGFLSAWGNGLVDIASFTFSGMYIAIYLSYSFPTLAKYSTIIAVVSIVICLFLNYLNISKTGGINALLAILAVVVLVIYAILIFMTDSFDTKNLVPFFGQGLYGNLGFLKAVPIAMLGYSSIMSISFMTEEIENPQKNIPKSIFTGMAIVMILYSFVILSTAGAITSNDLNATGMVYIPLFAVCKEKLTAFPFLQVLLSISAILSLLTTMVVVIAYSGRNLKAVADKNLLPKVFSTNGRNDTPIVAMTVPCLIAIILSLFQGLTEFIINVGALFAIITICINLLSLLVTRRDKPDVLNKFVSPISSPFVIVVMLLMIICYIPDIITGGKNLLLVTIIWYLIGVIVYKWHRRVKHV